MTLFVITAPSGAGKTSIMNYVKGVIHTRMKECISDTTRDMRVGEEDGITYNYLSKEKFKEYLELGAYAEHVEYDGHNYGIKKSTIENALSKSNHAYIIAEYNGYKQIKKAFPQSVGIFMYMEKEKCLANMLLRGDSMESALKRISTYDDEMKNRNGYDYVVKNVFGDITKTAQVISAIIKQSQK